MTNLKGKIGSIIKDSEVGVIGYDTGNIGTDMISFQELKDGYPLRTIAIFKSELPKLIEILQDINSEDNSILSDITGLKYKDFPVITFENKLDDNNNSDLKKKSNNKNA